MVGDLKQSQLNRLDRLFDLDRLCGDLLDQALLLRRIRETADVAGQAISPSLRPETLIGSQVRADAVLSAKRAVRRVHVRHDYLSDPFGCLGVYCQKISFKPEAPG